MHCGVFQRKFIIEALSSRVPSALKYGEVSVLTWVLPPPFVESMTVSAAASVRFNSRKNRNTTDIRARPNHVIPANQVAAKKEEHAQIRYGTFDLDKERHTTNKQDSPSTNTQNDSTFEHTQKCTTQKLTTQRDYQSAQTHKWIPRTHMSAHRHTSTQAQKHRNTQTHKQTNTQATILLQQLPELVRYARHVGVLPWTSR